MNLIILLLMFFSPFLSANPDCPNFIPPQTVPFSGWSYSGPANKATPEEACQTPVSAGNCSGWGWVYAGVGDGPNPYTKACLTRKDSTTNACAYVTAGCPAGYTRTNDACTLTNASLVPCPPVVCTIGKSVGLGGASAALVCLDGCQIKPRGMSASEIDASGNDIGVKLSEWEQTGSTCVSGGTLPVANNIDPNKPNCISNGARQLCISTTNPGCGTVNGKEWCPDKVGCGSINGQRVCVPDDGGCSPSGGSDFACTKGANPPAQPATEPPPVVDFKASVPVQNGAAPAGGTPTNGAMPKTDGSDTGGTAPVTIGHYPGTSGNGTGGGNDPADTDTEGLAQESTLQSILNALSGSVSGSAFNTSTLNTPANVNLDPQVTEKQAEITAKIQSIKSEISALITFGGASTPSTALQCPSNSGFAFMGSSISLCTQSVLSATASIGNVLIFLALVVSFFILLS